MVKYCLHRAGVDEVLVHHLHLVEIGLFPWPLLEVHVLRLGSSALHLDKGKNRARVLLDHRFRVGEGHLNAVLR